MDRSLWLLLGLRLRSWLRRWGRNLRTLKGFLLALVGAIVFAPALIGALIMPKLYMDAQITFIQRFGALVLLGTCLFSVLLSAGEKAISFAPAEIDFLFAGPYPRRQLLVMKIVASLGIAGLSAFFFTILVGNHAANPVSAYVGLLLALELIYLFTLTIGVASSTIAILAHDRLKKWILGAVGVVIVVALVPLGREVFLSEPAVLLRRMEGSPIVRAILVPFQPFAMSFASRRLWPDLAKWTALAGAVDLGLVALLLGLNARYYEASASASVKIYARLREARRGNLWAAPSKVNVRLPVFPWWGGVGPNLWRQATTAVRQPNRFLSLLSMFLLPMVILVVTMNATANPTVGVDVSVPALATLGGLALFAPTLVGFDFRPDVARMETLKVLPIPPRRLVLGQVVAPALILTMAQWLALVVIALLTRPNPIVLIGIVVLSLPLNVFLVEIENLFFLWYPVPFVSGLAMDFETTGRQMILLLAKATCVGMVAALAGALAAAVYYYVSQTWFAAFSTAWIVLSLACWGLLPMLALAFSHFDVSRDTPV